MPLQGYTSFSYLTYSNKSNEEFTRNDNVQEEMSCNVWNHLFFISRDKS